MIDKKSNDQMAFRVPDEIKEKFSALAHAENKSATSVLIQLMESYIAEREQYIDSVARHFGYSRRDRNE